VISAGSGAPDVAQVEYFALPQFALPGHLVDLRDYGFDEFASDYTASTWEAVHAGEGLFGLPQDQGMMALFYNQRIFDEYDLTVPTTWDEFLAAARQLKDADPTKYITGDPGEPGQDMGLIWQAGGRPFAVDGDQITINLQDEGTMRWTSTWNQLLEEDHLAPFPHWTEEWFAALADGTIATLPFGGWMGGVFAGFEDGVGDWRVAPMPTYAGGQPVTAQHGGSSQAVLEQSQNPALAAAFLRWLNHEGGVQVFLETGGVPATVADLEDPEFVNAEWDYFSGQKVNEVLVDAASTVGEGWQFLPYQTYANSIFGDTVGQSFLNKTNINDGLQAWQDALVEYGNQQGFQVNGG
jgi:multiple sugar transport system substrate-binding protein